jgi:acetylornithine deacetylase/succinyl-diaminopimelate desuccinylase-like protein
VTRPGESEQARSEEAAEERPGGLLADLVELACIPAPTFAEEPRLAWLERRLAGAPGRVKRDGTGNLVWSWGDGAPELVVAAHVDTVFPAGTRLRVERQGKRLVGPGIGDNAAGVVVAVHVVSELLAGSAPRPGAVAFTIGEEGLGNLRGARAVCDDLEPRAFIALEGQGLERIDVDAVGSVRARVEVTGPGGHSWRNRGDPSAIHGLLELAPALVAQARPEVPVNVGLISGGRSVNAIADRAELVVETRALDEEPLVAFERLLGGLELEAPLRVVTEIVGRRPAGRLERSHPLLASVRAVRSELGLPDELGAGSTDANAALAAGIPALCLGVSIGAGMHTLEEWIEVDSLGLGKRQLALVMRRLLL